MRLNGLRSIPSCSTRWPLIAGLSATMILSFAVSTRANAPAGRYTYPAMGTVLDAKTGLVWQQKVSTTPTSQPVGTSTCFNNPMGLSGTGWRLPTVKELLTLVDSAHASGLDTVAFASEPLVTYWSSTTLPGNPNTAWFVAFGPGNNTTGTDDTATGLRLVRCVR